MSANLLNFKLTLEDLLGPKVAAAIRQVQSLGSQVDKPHKMNVDTSAAKSGLQGIKSILGGLGLAFGAFEAFNFLKDSVTKFNEADQAGAQFDATLKSTGATVGITREELLKMSTDLMGKSLFDDDAITQAQSVLLGFTQIKGAVYKDALPAIMDLSAKMGTDLQTSVLQVGKALNDPVKGFMALKKAGVTLSESQIANIKTLAATGHMAEAQGIIIKELGKEFGGSAEAASKAGTGGWTVLKNKFDNIRESIGGLLVSGAGSSMPFFTKLVDQGQIAIDWVSSHIDGLKAVFAPLLDAVQPLITVFEQVQKELYGGADAGSMLTTAFNAIGGVIKFISPAIKVMAILLGEVVKFQVQVYQAIFKFIETSPRLQKFFVGLWEGAVNAFKAIAQAAGKFLGGIGGIIEGVFTGDFGKIKEGLKSTFSALTDANPVSIGIASAKGFVKGYKKGFVKTDFFPAGTAAAPAAAAGADAASAFLNKKPGGAGKPTALTAAASGGGVSGVGGKGITNITLRIDTLMRDVRLSGATMGESVKDLAALIRDTVIAELNDVNTLASN